jgi:hypothetical protein
VQVKDYLPVNLVAISLCVVFRGFLCFLGGIGEKNFSGMLAAEFPGVCG